MPFERSFTEHPAAVRESHNEHMGVAVGFAGPLLAAGATALVHAVLPFPGASLTSGSVIRLHARMVNLSPQPSAQPS